MHYIQQGEGRPIILQHGLGASANQTMDLIALPDVRLVSMECPGHGVSELKGVPPSFDYYTNEVILMMDALGIDQATVGGISMGAGIALNMALRFPGRVDGLVLIRPAWLDKANPSNLQILLEAAKAIRDSSEDLFFQSPSFLEIQELLPAAAESVRGLFATSQRKELPIVLESMVYDAPLESLHDLEKLDLPCLIIGNDDDPLHPFEMVRQLHDHLPISELKKVTSRYVDNQAHSFEINELIATFMAYEK